MSEDCQTEDEAEKLAENPVDAIVEYLSEHDAIKKEELIEFLTEKCGLDKDEAEKVFEDLLEKGRLRYSKAKGGYILTQTRTRYARMPFPGKSFSEHRRARGRIESVLRLPPDPHTIECKSYFLARDNPGQPYYHPAMDQDKLAYLRAREKMGEGADWPA